MAEQETTATFGSFASDQVAPLLPAAAPAPEAARRINFFVALLVYWIVPKRIGPHLAVGTWKRAWAAHVIAVLLATVLPVLIVAGTRWFTPAGLHELRVEVAQVVIMMASGSSSMPSWVVVLIPIGVVFGAELLLVLLAILLMPWCAGGDSAGSVFRRSLKNVYWSTTYWVIAAAAIAWLTALDSQKDSWLREMRNMPAALVVMFVSCTPIFLWIRGLLVGASRYVGPPAGPAFKPREPLCEQCGYCITGLNVSADCPECGWPVRYSLPGGRRQPTVWQQHPFRLRGLREAARLQWALFRDRDFFRRLPVHEGHVAARHFWWATLFFILVADLVICLAIFPLIAAMADLRESTLLAMKSLMAVIGLVVPFLLQAFVAFAACLWAQLRVGIRDYRVSATVCYYASPLMWPVVIFIMIGFALLTAIPNRMIFNSPVLVLLGLELTPGALIAIGTILLVIAALLFWWLRLLAALRKVRYANV